MKTVYIIFGEMGCGKTYQGSRFAERHGYKFFDGDSVIPQCPRMLEKAVNFKAIPQDVLDEYMDVLFNAIADQMQTCDNLVVSQAFYRNKHREELKKFLESFGYKVKMWWIISKWHRVIEGLMTRENGWKWVLYWLTNKPFFQKPTHEYQLWRNVYYD